MNHYEYLKRRRSQAGLSTKALLPVANNHHITAAQKHEAKLPATFLQATQSSCIRTSYLKEDQNQSSAQLEHCRHCPSNKSSHVPIPPSCVCSQLHVPMFVQRTNILRAKYMAQLHPALQNIQLPMALDMAAAK